MEIEKPIYIYICEICPYHTKDPIGLQKERNVRKAQTCSPAPTIASRSELYNISTITKAPAATNKSKSKKQKTSIHSFRKKLKLGINLGLDHMIHCQNSDTINMCLMSALQEVVFNIRSYLDFD